MIGALMCRCCKCFVRIQKSRQNSEKTIVLAAGEQNSRYVLQKAQFLPPFDFLKGVEKNLSVKIPKDDPTKPALRVNIPEDRPRSKSIGSTPQTPPIKPTFQETLIPATENDIQFSQFTVDDILGEDDMNSSSQTEGIRLSAEKARGIEQRSYEDDMETVAYAATNSEAIEDNFYAATDSEKSNAGIQGDHKRQNVNTEDEIDPKNLYIIIDVPGKREEKRFRVSDLVKEKSADLLHDKSFTLVRGIGQNLERKSKSVPRFSTVKRTSPKQMRSNFEVHEFDDESTYVFHLKLNKKDGGILCVPERDVTTRHGEDKLEKMDSPITAGSLHPLRKQVTIVEDRPEAVKYDGTPTKVCKGGELKRNNGGELKRNNGSEDVSIEPGAVGLTRIDEHGKRRGKGCNLFVEDDFRSIRNGIKTYPFKMPSKQNEKKRDGENSNDDPAADIHENMVTTSDWWKKDPREEAKYNYEIEVTKMKDGIISPYKDKNENVEPTQTEGPLPPVPPAQPPPEPQAPQKKKPEPTSPYFNISDVISDNPDYTIMNRNLSDTMYDTKEHFHNRPETKPRTPIDEENGPKYFNIEEVIPEEKRQNLRRITDRRRRTRKFKQPGKFRRLTTHGEMKKAAKEGSDFHTAANCLTIGSESSVNGFLPFGSAFPPLLSEALKNRFKFRKGLMLTDRWNNIETGLKGRAHKECALEENAILFPDKHSGDLECDNLFVDREEIIANLIKSFEEQTLAKAGSETPAPSVDPLTMMKKVKEIVQFDLNNAVKIFNDGGGNSEKELSSVVLVKGEGAWQVDRYELNRHVQMRKKEMRAETAIRSAESANRSAETANRLAVSAVRSAETANRSAETANRFAVSAVRSAETANRPLEGKSVDKPGSKTGDSQMPLYLPPKTENDELKLLDENRDSVVMFDSKSNEFFIRKEALAKAISERTYETFGEVLNTLTLLAEENLMDAKNGDSILVYDVETKSWKVDFSILEKRRQQQQIEEELTKRSEAILETFERLEKEQFNAVPKPNSRDKKTFDYEKEQWKAYNSGNKNMSKSKLPFKKSNAEEIRKKNSDLYENLFDGKKKIAANNSAGNGASSDPAKQSKLCGSKQTDSTGANAPKGTSTPVQPAKSDTKVPLGKNKPHKDEDHFWESFLRIHIPPKPSKGPLMEPLRSPSAPQPSIQPKTPPATSVFNVPKVEPDKSVIPPKKIDEPRFRIHIPFIRDKKSDKSKAENPPKDDKKVDQTKQPFVPQGKIEKKEEPPPKVKAPPPPSSTTTKGDPPKGLPKTSSTVSTPGSQSNVDTPASKSSTADIPSSSSTSKIQDSKTPAAKNDKSASASDHYVSDKIIELTRSKNADHHSKVKANKVETVKLNITSDTRLPSKVTEINLGKKSEENGKEPPATKKSPVEASASKSKLPVPKQSKGDMLKLNKHLEGFKTSFSEPDFEEKLMKIKPDLESNPNLKKLDNWSKTLVLHDIMKPPENLETWLKDETDKMATLLLKVLQEAGDAKAKKKQTKAKDKHLGKGSDRKKQKPADNYFFRVQTMNLALGNDKKVKTDNAKLAGKPEPIKDVSVQTGKLASSSASLNTVKLPNVPSSDGDGSSEYNKPKRSHSTFGPSPDSLMYKDLANQVRFPLDITDDVPGPEFLKKIANAWRVVPILGSQLTVFSLYRLFQLVNLGTSALGGSRAPITRSQAFIKLFNKYGPVVNVQGPLSGNVIFMYKPEHLHAVFDQDAPLRSVFDSFEQSRKDLEERSSPTAISTDWNKAEWNELRRGTNDPLTKGWEMYFGSTKTAAESLVYVIRRNRNAQDLVSEDLMHEIKRWSLEGMCQVLFEKSFGYLEGRVNSDSWILEPEKLYMAMDEATNYLNKCERGFQAWRLFTTPSLAGLTDSYRSISSVILKQLNQAEINLKNKNEVLRNGSFMANMDLTFIESMLLNDGLTPDEMICNLADTMVIGTSMLNSGLGFLLYNLAQNVHAQKKLFTELKEILPSKSSQLDYYKLTSLKYLQACIKESLRLHPPIPIFYRLLQNDILVGNYIIPKGSYVVMDCGLSNMKEQNFEDSRKFIPERWIDDEKLAYSSLPLAPFPFCHGPRGELIKRVVEMQLTAGIAKIIRNFTIEYHYEDIQGTDTFISYPDKPLKLNFVERDC